MVPKWLKGPKPTYTTIANAEKQSKWSTKGPFSLYIGSPGSHPGNGTNGAREGKVPPGPPGFSSHASKFEQVIIEFNTNLLTSTVANHGLRESLIFQYTPMVIAALAQW